uniref:Uncharacterized protein n=1 Tax=Sphaerodactylus townsendi TaxID=933632 RepID=A0ACB8EUX2_9SAUR
MPRKGVRSFKVDTSRRASVDPVSRSRACDVGRSVNQQISRGKKNKPVDSCRGREKPRQLLPVREQGLKGTLFHELRSPCLVELAD